MGIQGLLPQLKPIQQPVTLRRYSGQTLAIDGYAWLHRAAHSCAMELATDQPTTKYLQFFIKRLTMLRSTFNITPYLVFDGDSINVKKETDSKRREKRQENKERGLKLWHMGDKKRSLEYFQKCVAITPEMAKCVIEYCKVQKVQYIVAPFEADAQMVYLENHGFAHGIISEDSDLLIFGCRRLITKLNDYGECIEICSDDFNHLPSKFPLCQLNREEIRMMVCLSGCDYTSGIPQVGLLTAMKLVKKFRNMDKILLSIQREGKLKIPQDFTQEYQLANFAFQFQRVFCPKSQRIVTLNVIPETLYNNKLVFQCVGKVISKQHKIKTVVEDDDDIDHDLHRLVSLGELNPYDFHKPLVNREHRLQLVSKSEPILMNNSENENNKNNTIDSFFHRKKLSTPKMAKNQGIDIQNANNKLGSTVERRKLYKVDDNLGSTSKFFATAKVGRSVGNAREEKPEEENKTVIRLEQESIREPIVVVKEIEKENIQLSTTTTTTTTITRKRTETLTATEDGSSQDEDDIATEVPSSMVPTQVDPQESLYEEDESESEVLSEVDEIENQRADKRQRTSAVGLREKFSYNKSTLHAQEKDSVGCTRKSKLIVVKGSLPRSCEVQQRPALRRSVSGARNRVVVGTSSPSATPTPAIRSTSLSHFVYRG